MAPEPAAERSGSFAWPAVACRSRHYVTRWRTMLAGPVERVAEALLEPGAWRDALFQNTPWSFALEPPGA